MKEISEFITTKCCSDTDKDLSNKDLYAAFSTYCPQVPSKVFFSRIKEQFDQFHARGVRFTKGISLNI